MFSPAVEAFTGHELSRWGLTFGAYRTDLFWKYNLYFCVGRIDLLQRDAGTLGVRAILRSGKWIIGHIIKVLLSDRPRMVQSDLHSLRIHSWCFNGLEASMMRPEGYISLLVVC